MKYTIYQITNAINNKIYIGCHKTNDLDDGYMGSGLLIRRAIEKYGVENFEKEYLHIFDSSEEMFDKETELVNESFVKRSDTYNLKQGGFGGWDHVIGSDPEKIAERNRLIARTRKVDSKLRAEVIRNIMATPGWKERNQAGYRKFLEENGGGSFKGKHHTDETKAKIGKANAIHQKGEGNTWYGTCWIHNSKESKRIKKDVLQQYLDNGWIKGRKMKFI